MNAPAIPAAVLRDKLLGLSKNAVLDLFRGLRDDGKVGFDHDRVSKADCIDRLLSAYSVSSIIGVLGEADPFVGDDVKQAVEDIDFVEQQVAKAPAPAPVPAPAPMVAAPAMPDPNALSQLGMLIAQVAGGSVNEAKVREIVQAELAGKAPRDIRIIQADKPEVVLKERVNPQFDKVLKLAAAGVNVMLVGPAGCGKTHMAHQVAKALGKTFGSISGSAGVSEAQLTGRLLPTGENGRFEYTPSVFVREYEKGGVFLFDEMDAFDSNCLLVVNQATANGGFDVEARASAGLDTYVKRHPEAIMIGSANTYGTGAGALYVGRSQLDAATMDRWYIVEVDYDKEFETELAPAYVCNFVWELRKKIAEHKIRRVASTRMIQKAKLALDAGLKWADVQNDLLAGWTAEERKKAGV